MLGTNELVNPLHKKAVPWYLVLNPALCIKCKPLGLVLKKSPSWQVGCFSRPCHDSFALPNEDWAVYDSEVTVAIIALLCLGVVSPSRQRWQASHPH